MDYIFLKGNTNKPVSSEIIVTTTKKPLDKITALESKYNKLMMKTFVKIFFVSIGKFIQ